MIKFLRSLVRGTNDNIPRSFQSRLNRIVTHQKSVAGEELNRGDAETAREPPDAPSAVLYDSEVYQSSVEEITKYSQ